MFRVKEEGLPPDAVEPADLKELGYFVNAVGQIRMIDFPDKDYLFHWYNQERHNEVRREAMQTCQRDEVLKRLSALGIEQLYLPQLTNAKPVGPHVAILAPPAHILKTRKRVIVLVNDSLQDLGILAYRRLQRELGLNGGSVIDFTKKIIECSTTPKEGHDIFKDGAGVEDKEMDTPGLIVLNCGQLIYSHKYNRAMTLRSWASLPRKSLCHDMIKIHPVHNHIQGHENPKNHIKWVFDHVVHNEDFIANDAEVYVIGVENGGENLVEILDHDFERYAARITALALINIYMDTSQVSNPHLLRFLRQRTRHWKVATSSTDPSDCIEIPVPQAEDDLDNDSDSQTQQHVDPSNPVSVNWLETTASTSTTSPAPTAIPPSPSPPSIPTTAQTPLCPTFASPPNPAGAGECILTHPLLHSILLSFFSTVSLTLSSPSSPCSSSSTYKNPPFAITSYEPTYDFDDDGNENIDDDSGYAELTPAPAGDESSQDDEALASLTRELREKKEELQNMRHALRDIPVDRVVQNEGLEKGRRGLERRIEWVEGEVRGLEEQIEEAKERGSGFGGVGGEGVDVNGNGNANGNGATTWKRVGEGPECVFAGRVVSEELVTGAGLGGEDEEVEVEIGE